MRALQLLRSPKQKQAATHKLMTHNTRSHSHKVAPPNAEKCIDRTTIDQNTVRASSIIRKELKTSSVGSALHSNRMEKYLSKRQRAKLQDDVKNILSNCLPRDYRSAVRSYKQENHEELASL